MYIRDGSLNGDDDDACINEKHLAQYDNRPLVNDDFQQEKQW